MPDSPPFASAMRWTVALTLAALFATSPSAQTFPEPSAELCAPYRQGPLRHRQVASYYGAVSDDPASFFWLDVWYRPEYLNEPYLDAIPDPNGRPQRDLLFDLDNLNGQPLPLAERRRARPQQRTFFSLLLTGGVAHMTLDRITRGFARQWDTETVDGVITRPVPDFVRTGRIVVGMEEIAFPSQRYLPGERQREEFFASFNAAGGFSALLRCDVAGTVVVPFCNYYERADLFELKIGGFRPDQLDLLDTIREHARNFTACLTLEGE